MDLASPGVTDVRLRRGNSDLEADEMKGDHVDEKRDELSKPSLESDLASIRTILTQQEQEEAKAGEPIPDEILDGLRRIIQDDKPEWAIPTVASLTLELEEYRRRVKAAESILLTKISQEFEGDPRRMARAILDLRMELRRC
jgi:hypothetical protein